MHYELKTRQICLFVIAFLPITKFFILPSLLAIESREDMWISAMISIIVSLISVIVVTNCCKKADTNFYGLLERAFGKTGSKVILCIYALTFFLKGILPVIEQKDYVELTLFFTMPDPLYFMPFFVCAFIVCTKRLRVLGRLSDMFWIFTVIGYFILFSLSVPNIELDAVLPIFANPIDKIFKGSYLSTTWFSDSIYLLFFIGEFRYEKKSSLKIVLSYIAYTVMIIIFIIAFYCTFTSISFKQHFALTETSKYTTVINNTGRFDYLGIALFLISGVISLILPMYFCVHLVCKVFDIKKRWIVSLTVCILYSLPVTVLNQYNASIQNFIVNYASAFFVLTCYILPLFLPLLPLKEKKYEVSYN